MKVTARLLAPVGIVVLNFLGCTRSAKHNMDVGTCAELQQAADLTNSGDTIAVITADEIVCDEWTNFEIKGHSLQLMADDDDNSSTFVNVRFLVPSGALRAEQRLYFTSTDQYMSQQVNGGILNIGKEGYVRFNGRVSMFDVTIMSAPNEGSDESPERLSGGCVYNEGTVRFEKGFSASNCNPKAGAGNEPGDGGGIFNGRTGNIVFKGGGLALSDCGYNINEANFGGGIYNEGKITMFEHADFRYNGGAAGGAIYNKGVMKFLKNASAVFYDNHTYRGGDRGGQVMNLGTILFKGGASFEDGFAGAEGGAIANTDTLIIDKSAVFTNNVARKNGGAIYSPAYATLEIPEATVFEGNTVTDDDGNCDNWYQQTTEDNMDFVCLWD